MDARRPDYHRLRSGRIKPAAAAPQQQRQGASNRGQFIAGDVVSHAAAGPTGKPQAGYPVAFASTSGWLHRLAAAHDRNALDLELRKLHRYRLIIIDEVGYLPPDATAASLFFQLIANRYETGPVITRPPSPA